MEFRQDAMAPVPERSNYEPEESSALTFVRSRLRQPGRLLRTALISIGVGGMLFITTFYLLFGGTQVSTDDAYVKGRITYVSAKVAGHVAKLFVEENQQVVKGQLVAELDARDYDAALGRAKAVLDAAIAKHHRAEIDLAMAKVTAVAKLGQMQETMNMSRAAEAEQSAALLAANANDRHAATDLSRLQQIPDRLIGKQQIDAADAKAQVAAAKVLAAKRRLTVARARTARAQAAVRSAETVSLQLDHHVTRVSEYAAEIERRRAEQRLAELNLSQTKIYATESGRIGKKAVEVGSYVQPGTPMLAQMSDEIWVEANFKETQLGKVRPGQVATLRVDAFPDQAFRGRVDSFRPGTGSQYSLLPPENATGNFVKVVQRVPIKIVFVENASTDRLLAGMSVVASVEVN